MPELTVIGNLTLDQDSVKELVDHYGINEEAVRFIDRRMAMIYENRLKVWQQMDLSKLEEEQDAKIKDQVKKYLDALEAERKPLTQEQVQALLDQQYATFTVELPGKDGTKKTFTIQELPSEAEEKFYNQFQSKFMERASDVAALAQETMDQPLDSKIKSFLTIFGGSFDMLASAVVLVLNHDGADKDLNVNWVKKNMSSHRQWNIVKAQIEVNKLRDFFSELFQSGTRTMTMTTGLNAQQLRQLQVR